MSPKEIGGPRHQSRSFPNGSASEYFYGYAEALSKAIRSIDPEKINEAAHLIDEVSGKGGRIWIAGNGGSASISEHLCCDWTYGVAQKSTRKIRTHSLMSNGSVLTALSNDLEYSESIARQLELLADAGDLLVLISSSGQSANVVKALETAEKMEIQTIAFTAFEGGALKRRADVSVHVDIDNYGIAEDCHQILMHVISQFFGSHE